MGDGFTGLGYWVFIGLMGLGKNPNPNQTKQKQQQHFAAAVLPAQPAGQSSWPAAALAAGGGSGADQGGSERE